MQGDVPGASEYAIAATELWRALGDRRWLARSLMSLGTCSMLIGDPERALASSRESVAIYRALGERWGLAIMLAPAAMVELNCAHDSAQARAWAEESIHLFQGFGNREAAALPLWTLGEIEYAQGNYEKARQSFQSGLDLYRGGFPRSMINMTRSSLANVNWRLGRYDAALSLYAAVIAEWQQMSHLSGIARCLECVAFVYIDMAKDQSEQARETLLKRGTRLLGAAEILREKLDSHMLPSEQVEYEQAMVSLRAGLDAASLSAAWAEGRTLTMEEAIADASKRN
jgi:tetratricopeptide (TPR) repeat protein